MDAVRSWIVGISAAAVLSALARALTERSAGRSVIRFFAGICVLLSILSPLQKAVPTGRSLSDMFPAKDDPAALGLAVSDDLIRRYASGQAAAYLESRLAAPDAAFSVCVELDDSLQPVSAEIRGPEASRETAVAAAADALRLPQERVRYIAEERSEP